MKRAMQMKLKNLIIISFTCLCIWGCHSRPTEYIPWESVPTEQMGRKSVRAAVLLPLSGKSAAIGEAFQNSSMMALQEQQGSPLELMFYDTKGTAEGTTNAWQLAKRQHPDVVIGPVFAPEVKALKVESPDVAVLSFTTDSSLMESGVYTLGVLIPNQIERLVSFMCEAGQRKIAVMGPEDKTAELTMNTLSEAVQACPGMSLKHVALYAPETSDFRETISKIIPTLVDPRKTKLTERERKILDTPIEERLDFDALLIFENGIRLQQLTSLLAYYDVSPKVVPFYGLANWQEIRDRGLIGGYFAATPVARSEFFNNRYRDLFGAYPPRIAALAYDAVSLVAVLADRNALTAHNLVSPTGFNGVNGRFRFKSNGLNERLLDVYQITPSLKSGTISPAPDTFDYIPL